MKLNEFVNSLAVISGVQADNEALKQFLSDINFDKEIPDDVWKSIESYNKGLLTMDAAKNNTEIRDHFYANTLDGLDEKINEKAKNLSEDQQRVIVAEKNSYEKWNLLNRFQDENWSKKLSEAGDGKVDVSKYETEITDLNSKLGTQHTDWETKFGIQKTENEKNLLKSSIQNHFTNYDYSDALSREEYALLANNKFNTEVQNKGWNVISNGNGLEIKTSDGLEIFENNEKVTFQSLANKVTAGYLKANPGNPNPNPTPIPAGTGKGLETFTASLQASIDDGNQ